MPRPRAVDQSPRQSPQDPPNVRTSTADADPILHHRSKADKSSPRKSSDGRSPRGACVQSRPSEKKKIGTRIADLESQLGLAQEELRNLKDHLTKKEKPKTQINAVKEEVDLHSGTDVFEVPFEPEIDDLQSNFDGREKQLEALMEENEGLKAQIEEKSLSLSSAESEVDELKSKLSKAEEELMEREDSIFQVNEKLQATEKAKVELEEEMRKLRVQMEQWKKAANAAASVVISERCGSIDKRYYSEPFNGDYDYVGSPRGFVDEADDDDYYGNGKNKKGGSGIKMFGELWKKKVMK